MQIEYIERVLGTAESTALDTLIADFKESAPFSPHIYQLEARQAEGGDNSHCKIQRIDGTATKLSACLLSAWTALYIVGQRFISIRRFHPCHRSAPDDAAAAYFAEHLGLAFGLVMRNRRVQI
ncbi:MAG: hypothetical protein R2867_08555 [Caldilineaceae bacterium]